MQQHDRLTWVPAAPSALYELNVWARSAGNGSDVAEAQGVQGYTVMQQCLVSLWNDPAHTQPRTTDQAGPGGGTGMLQLTVDNAPCGWRGTPDVPWLLLTAGQDAGTASGTLRWDVRPNPGTATRVGHIAVGDETITITQTADTGGSPCTYTVSPTSLLLTAEAGAHAQVDITAGVQCGGWEARSQANFLTTNPETGTGNGYTTISAANNGLYPRAGFVLVSGQLVYVSQRGTSGDVCSYELSPARITALPSGGTFAVYVDTDDDCAWLPTPKDPWLHVTTVGLPHGPGTFTFTVDAATVGHTGRITIGTVDLIVEQGTPPPPGATPYTPLGEPQDTGVFYYHADAIGSVRAITDATGTVVARYDFLPNGQTFGNDAGSSTNRVQFAGKERDPETAAPGTGPLDYFGARYYQSQTGRFSSVDPDHVNGNLTDPQSWNGYAYARNNPLKYSDPTGMEYEICAYGSSGSSSSCGTVSDQGFAQLARNPGGGAQLWGGAVYVGNKVVGYYRQTSVDPSLREFIQQTGARTVELAKATAVEYAKQAAIELTLGLGLAIRPSLEVMLAARVRTGFKTGHYARRLLADGISVDRAELAVQRTIRNGGPLHGTVAVDGITLEYRAMELPGGEINVGTIFKQK